MCSGSQMTQLLSAEGAANKARHYTKKQNKSESEGWLCFWEKLHHTTARAPSQREFPLPMHHIVAKREENSAHTIQPEHRSEKSTLLMHLVAAKARTRCFPHST